MVMTQDQFYTWLENPALMDAASIPQLREVISRYPYFQAAQIMLAKNLRSENHIDQLNQLQLAAVMAPNRKVFHDYLHDKRKALQKVEETVEDEVKKETEQSNVVRIEPILQVVPQKEPEVNEAERDSLYDLIPEPIVYQLETADLPELAPKEIEEVAEPEELSFSEWLAYSNAVKSDSNSLEKGEFKREKPQPSRNNIELIDHFLTRKSGSPKKRAEFFNPQKAGAKSLEADFTVISETLAQIYFQQEKYELAKQSYEALSLKYPEKSVYFAARLKEIDEKLNLE